MAYIAFDLDALNVVPEVAAAAGVEPGRIAHGLLKLWAWCFRADKDVVSEVHLSGFFGAKVEHALEAFGFLERVEDGWRVRGAARFLKVKQAQREGGKKGRAKSTSTVGNTSGSTSRSTLEPTLGRGLKSQQGLTPTTHNPAPNTITTTTKEPSEQESSGAVAFWRFFMDIRQQETGRIPEAPPHPAKLGRWYSEALMELGGSDESLREAIRGFGADRYWREAGYPFAGFVKQWRKYAAVAQGE